MLVGVNAQSRLSKRAKNITPYAEFAYGYITMQKFKFYTNLIKKFYHKSTVIQKIKDVMVYPGVGGFTNRKFS